MPSRGSGSGSGVWMGNPFYSQRIQDECALQARRPTNLPMDEEWDPLPFSAGIRDDGSYQPSMVPTGKGRGDSLADGKRQSAPTVERPDGMRTEGEMPGDQKGPRTMGAVSSSSMNHGRNEKVDHDDLQRALEGELVVFLRNQNSKLMEELEVLKGKLQSTVDSSPWSAVGATSEESAKGVVKATQSSRHGRHGSRTPRSRVREHAVSPEIEDGRKSAARFTPGGTRVPDGPPPAEAPPVLPPVPPFPMC